MAMELFTDVGRRSVSLGSGQRYTVPLSIFAHAVALAALVVVPLVALDVVPAAQSVIVFAMTPSPKLPPAPAQPRESTPRPSPSAAAAPMVVEETPVTAPARIVAEPPGTSFAGIASRGLPGEIVPVAATSLAAAPALPAQVVVRPGGDIKEPRKTRDVRPIYPAVAMAARVEGVVVIEATIGTDGVVEHARVSRSQPLLDQAALDAVRLWRFTPTLLNGVPVEVIMTVTVNFTLH